MTRPHPTPRTDRPTSAWWSGFLRCRAAAAGLLTALLPHLAIQAQDPPFRAHALQPVGRGPAGFARLNPQDTGLAFTNGLSPTEAAENQIRLNGSGVAAGDVDGDGWCDLYVCSLGKTNLLFRNLGQWRFTNVTDVATEGCVGQYSTGATFADVDGDGDLDLLVNGIGSGTRLFLNDGHGKFTERPDGSGLVRVYGSTTSALADVDGDGDLDLYVANYRTTTIRSTGFAVLNVGGKRMIRPQDRDRLEYTPEGRILEHGEPHFLYLNDGQGRFAPVSWTQGAFVDEDGQNLGRAPLDWGLSAMFRDVNGDGCPDLYVCNDFHSTDKLWLNDGHGRFRLAPGLTFRHTPTFSMCVDFADVDRDGLDDLFISDMWSRHHAKRLMQVAAMGPAPDSAMNPNLRLQVDNSCLMLNRGDGTFADVAFYAQLHASEWNWSSVFLDVDLDGYEDLLCSTGHLFDTQDLDAEARIQAKGPWPRELIPQKLLMFPPNLQPKLAFRNLGNLRFEEVGARWGFHDAGVANGTALADLDNDGDLDVVVNQLNDSLGVYRNEGAGSRVGVRLLGRPPNTQGIGARVTLIDGAVPKQSQEILCGGRYLSGDQSMRTFAAGATGRPMRLEVVWRSGKHSRLDHVQPNHLYEIDERGAEVPATTAKPELQPLFADASERLSHRHTENDFDDFVRQPLLPKKLSRLGPGVAWVDLDGDGWDDLAIGAGKGGRLACFRNDLHGGFTPLPDASAVSPTPRDLTALVEWPTGNRTLVIAGLANYEDGLARDTAVQAYAMGTAVDAPNLPATGSSVGPLAVADVDGDGDLDLFVGGRVVASRYPAPASSQLWLNDRGQLRLDATSETLWRNLGLVSGAVFTDLTNDGLPELVLALEWGAIRVLSYQGGRWSDVTAAWGLEGFRGWWNGIAAGDFDGDGRMDLIGCNWGLNTKYQASDTAPRWLYFGDLDGDGALEIVEGFRDPVAQRNLPERDLVSMSVALPFLRETFATHQSYGAATVEQILGSRTNQITSLQANSLASMLFLNRTNRFEVKPLPTAAQFSPAFAAVVSDFDGDGAEDLFLSQNFFATEPQTSRADGGLGLWLSGDGRGGFTARTPAESGVRVIGEQRGAAACDYDHDGRTDLIVTQNAGETKVYHNVRARPGVRVRLIGPPANPHGIGAVIRLGSAGRLGPAREIHGGSGYWSQDSAQPVLSLATPPDTLWVRWPGGGVKTYPIEPAAVEVTASHDTARSSER